MTPATIYMTVVAVAMSAAPIFAQQRTTLPAPMTGPMPAPPLRVLPAQGQDLLQCRGGAVKTISFSQYTGGNSMVMVGFTKAKKAASQGLSPGECAWKTRPLTASEPANLCQKVDHVMIVTQHVHDASYNPSEIWILQSAWSHSAPWLDGIHSSDKVFSFHVTSDSGNHCLSVIP